MMKEKFLLNLALSRKGKPLFQCIVFFILIIFVFSFQSCALFKSNTSIDVSKLSPAQILAKVEQNNRRIQTLSGKGTLVIEMPETPFKGEVTIRVARPDSLYIVTEAAFGVDVGFLFADGKQFHSYSPIDNIYLTGHPDQIGSLVLFNMKIAYNELLNSILGAASFPLQTKTKIVRLGNKVVLSQPLKKNNLVYEVDLKRFVITKIQLFDRHDNETFRQEFRFFRKIKGIWVPKYIQLTRPQSKERLTVYYSKVDLNIPLSANQFTYKIPDNARRENLSR